VTGEHDQVRIAEEIGAVWLTRVEAAAYARVHANTIDRWRHEGLRYSGGNGKKILIRSDWLDEWIEHRVEDEQ